MTNFIHRFSLLLEDECSVDSYIHSLNYTSLCGPLQCSLAGNPASEGANVQVLMYQFLALSLPVKAIQVLSEGPLLQVNSNERGRNSARSNMLRLCTRMLKIHGLAPLHASECERISCNLVGRSTRTATGERLLASTKVHIKLSRGYTYRSVPNV